MSCHGAALQGLEWLCLQEQQLREITRRSQAGKWMRNRGGEKRKLEGRGMLMRSDFYSSCIIVCCYMKVMIKNLQKNPRATSQKRTFLHLDTFWGFSCWTVSLEVRGVCHQLYHPHQLGWRRGSLSQSRLRCPRGGRCRCGFTPLCGCEDRKQQMCQFSIIKSAWTSTIRTQVSLCSLLSCPVCHISTLCQGSMCHIQTHIQSPTCEYQMTNTHTVMHSPFSAALPLKWLHAGRWSVGPGWSLWTENRCSCRQRGRNVSPACWGEKQTSKSTSNILFTCSYIITPVTKVFVRVFWFVI